MLYNILISVLHNYGVFLSFIIGIKHAFQLTSAGGIRHISLILDALSVYSLPDHLTSLLQTLTAPVDVIQKTEPKDMVGSKRRNTKFSRAPSMWHL